MEANPMNVSIKPNLLLTGGGSNGLEYSPDKKGHSPQTKVLKSNIRESVRSGSIS
jgi:hypothetical protein